MVGGFYSPVWLTDMQCAERSFTLWGRQSWARGMDEW